jgi:hypothetical protein
MSQRTSQPGRARGQAAAPPRRRPSADRRIAERRKAIAATRVRRRRRQLLWGLVALVLAAGTVQLARTPLFGLGAVHVEGTGPTGRDQVLAAAGVRPGQPYLGLDLEAIRDRVAALPRVAAARVVRDYPAGLRIVVSERTPVASVRRAAVYWVVAADGTVLEAARAGQPPGQRARRARRHAARPPPPGRRRPGPLARRPGVPPARRHQGPLRPGGGAAGQGRRRHPGAAKARPGTKGGGTHRRPKSVGPHSACGGPNYIEVVDQLTGHR